MTRFLRTWIFVLIGYTSKCTCTVSCGGKLTDPEGNITSPNYPDDYPPGVFCFWDIVAPPGDVITLQFHQFELEFASKGCDYDYVIVVDGNSEFRYCGYEIPPKIRSHSYRMTVGFVTDANSQHKGFRASYNTASRLESVVTTSTTPLPTTTSLYKECGGNIYDSGATIVSPGYPESAYPPNVVCIWNIQPRSGSNIYLTFDLMDIDDSNKCADDYLQMLDADLKILGRFCGDVAPPLVIMAEKRMTVVFKSDSHVARRGFKLSYMDQEPPIHINVTQTFPPTHKHTAIGDSTQSSTPSTIRVSMTTTTTKTLEGGKLPNSAKGIAIGISITIIIVVIVGIITYCMRRKKQTNRILAQRHSPQVSPQLMFGTDKSKFDPEAASNHGYDAEGEPVNSNMSEVSTPWGTAKRSQLREMSPDYYGTGSRPQLGLPKNKTGSDETTQDR